MADEAESPGTPVSLVVGEFAEPGDPSALANAARTGLTAKQKLYFYSSDEWEEFLGECASVLKSRYVQVKRLGGANDQGVDIAGLKTENGFEGPWDCWQGKHYSRALRPSDAYPEVLKVLRHICAGSYVQPENYFFAAPQGCGTTLSRLLSKPTDFKAGFVEKLSPGDSLISGVEETELDQVRELANAMDFAVFRSVELHELLELHSSSPFHQARFDGALPDRPDPDEPPAEVCPTERRYVEQIVAAYQESYPSDGISTETIADHEKAGPPFLRHRVAFYSAESLRLYARDSVPVGTFERLQDDIHDGVIDVAEAEHASGLDRLRTVLTTSAQVDLSGHALVTVSRTRDRHGVCHQLSNDGRLSWVGES